MSLKIEGQKKLYYPKDKDVVECQSHGFKTIYGQLSPIAKLALEEGIDTTEDLPCLLSSN